MYLKLPYRENKKVVSEEVSVKLQALLQLVETMVKVWKWEKSKRKMYTVHVQNLEYLLLIPQFRPVILE